MANGPVTPRCYTLTHSDTTGDLFLTVGPEFDRAQISGWYTRLMRSQVLSIKEQPFIESARAIGVSRWRIMFRHILPNCLSPIIVQATLDMGYIILSVASLGFLGLGTQPPTADWGVMVSDGREFFMNQWWISTFSGGAIFLTVMAFNLVGDGIREALDPKIRWRFQKG